MVLAIGKQNSLIKPQASRAIHNSHPCSVFSRSRKVGDLHTVISSDRASVTEFMQSPGYKKILLYAYANKMRENFLSIRGQKHRETFSLKIREMENASNFLQNIDPSKPTLLMSGLRQRQEAYQFAKAAQDYKENAGKGFNIIFADPSLPDALEFVKGQNGEYALRAKSGIVVNNEGEICIGDFPQPVYIDKVDNPCLRSFYKNCSEKGIPLTTPIHNFKLSFDKKAASRVMSSIGVNCPPQKDLTIQNLKNLDKLIDSILSFPKAYGIVVKPRRGSQGDGVSMIKKTLSRQEIKAKIKDALKGNKSLVLEPWIKSFNCGKENKDMNFRVIASPKNAFAIEARIGYLGKPINVCQGAEVWDFTQIVNEMQNAGLQKSEIKNIIDEMKATAKKIAKHFGSQYQGMDFILDEDLKLWTLEGNIGFVGGVASLSNLAQNDLTMAMAPVNFMKSYEINKRKVLDGETEKIEEQEVKDDFQFILYEIDKLSNLEPCSSDEMKDFVSKLVNFAFREENKLSNSQKKYLASKLFQKSMLMKNLSQINEIIAGLKSIGDEESLLQSAVCQSIVNIVKGSDTIEETDRLVRLHCRFFKDELEKNRLNFNKIYDDRLHALLTYLIDVQLYDKAELVLQYIENDLQDTIRQEFPPNEAWASLSKPELSIMMLQGAADSDAIKDYIKEQVSEKLVIEDLLANVRRNIEKKKDEERFEFVELGFKYEFAPAREAEARKMRNFQKLQRFDTFLADILFTPVLSFYDVCKKSVQKLKLRKMLSDENIYGL